MIKLNFLPFINQNLSITVFRKLHQGERKPDSFYYKFLGIENELTEFEIKFEVETGFEEYLIPQNEHITLIGKPTQIDPLSPNQTDPRSPF